MRQPDRRRRHRSVGLCPRWNLTRRFTSAVAALAITACGEPRPGSSDAPQRPEILDVDSAEPLVEGSRLKVIGLALDAAGTDPALRVAAADVALPAVGGEGGGQRLFEVTGQLIDRLGEGEHQVTLAVRGADVSSPPFSRRIVLRRRLPVRLDGGPDGTVHRNELIVLRGAGMLSESEGTVVARFRGGFSRTDGGSTQSVDVELPVRPAERFARDRGVVRLTTALGGPHPGDFDGTIRLYSELQSGETSDSDIHETTLHFAPPELFGVEPTTVSLEQLVSVRGAGFLGGERAPGEATILQIEGTFRPKDEVARAVGPSELVPQFVSGTELRGVLAAEPVDGWLVSELLGAREGRFEGRATPIVVAGDDEVIGASVPVDLTLAPVRQVVYVEFLPGFYESLPRFGLGAAAGMLEPSVAERIEAIYDRWRIDVRLERPRDFSQNGYATVEIGGPDPNGLGLFGYDNTPGKDVGNLRLYDSIGGANAETQEDGYPGYGGVFVENFLHFSSHPGLSETPPSGAASTDPRFDEVFDPVRAQPARLPEVRGEGDAERVERVQRAVRALANLIGETAAHELGHSLGLADPFGPSDSYHHPVDRPGCLMDSGSDRPFGERAALPGYEPTTLCGDAPSYLDELHGR